MRLRELCVCVCVRGTEEIERRRLKEDLKDVTFDYGHFWFVLCAFYVF